MTVLLESQSSDLFKEWIEFQLKSSINSEIITQSVNQKDFLTKIEQRQILDLILAPMSPNRVARHFSQVFQKRMSPWNIKQLVFSYGTQIENLNKRFDKIAGCNVIILQIDETFKGQKVSILVVVDALTGYIFHLEWLDRRTEEVISRQLRPLRMLLGNVKLIITDGAPYFPEVAKNLCPDAFHQICLVHVMRGLYPYLQVYKTKFHEDLRIYQSINKALQSNKMKKKEKCYIRKKLVQQLTYWKQKRRKFRENHDLVPYQKGVFGKYPELKKINEKLNLIRAQIRSLNYTIENLGGQEIRLKAQKDSAFQHKSKTWGQYMTKCRLLHHFYRLFNLKGKRYELERFKFLSHLKEKSEENCELIQEISRLLLNINNLDTVNKAECPIQLDYHYINTNSIENINSQIRPYLECLRNITNSDYVKIFFSLLRFYLNTRRPFSGIHCDTSPVERYGYDLRGKNYLDLLQDGLPTGPQYEIYNSKIDLSYVAPNMVNNCKFQPTLKTKITKESYPYKKKKNWDI